MKKILYVVAGIFALLNISSCTKNFLEKPGTTGSTTVETIFSNRTAAETAITNAYRSTLVHGLWGDGGINNGNLSGISGELAYGEGWGSLKRFVDAGLSPTAFEQPAQSTDNFFNNYSAIRKNFIIQENIDKVTDMDVALKATVKAEVKGLVAYRYMGMFIRYGGVPIVTKSLQSSDDLAIPRANLQETLDYIIKLSTDAAAGLPDKWEDKYTGRLTKGTALAIKARTLMFAARPLFNSGSAYLSFGDNNKLITLGSEAAERWQDAVTANEAVLAWANQNGYALINTGGGTGVPNSNAFDDYATATSTPANKEVLLAYKLDEIGNKFYKWYNPNRVTNNERYLTEHYGMLTAFLTNYYKADGTNQIWPGFGVANALPFSDYIAKVNVMEPRFKADNMAHTLDPWNNLGDANWAYTASGAGENHEGQGRGNTQSTKFYYKAGSRGWFEFPLFRMAEFYLNLAEAYNEVGNPVKALQNLNMVHNRAGLPSITETDKARLRTIIQREWAIEYYNENQRYFQVKHWKLSDLANGIMGGGMREFQFTLVSAGANDRLPSSLLNYYDKITYTAYWNPKMFLEPFPQSEIDKGVLVQNPGY